jgi:hypothetical protein
MTLGVRLNNVPTAGRNFAVSLTGQETAAQKAAKIAAAMDNTTFPVTASANGNMVTVDTTLAGLFVSSLWVVNDNTGEVNQLLGMSPGDPSRQVAIVEFPAQSPGAVPPAGQSAAVAFSTDMDNVNGSVVSDGTSTDSMLLSQLNASMGLSWTAHSDPASGQTYLESGPFDPISASIEWNAFTGESLANFGLEFFPEPASLSVLLFGCVALRPRRRRGDH